MTSQQVTVHSFRLIPCFTANWNLPLWIMSGWKEFSSYNSHMWHLQCAIWFSQFIWGLSWHYLFLFRCLSAGLKSAGDSTILIVYPSFLFQKEHNRIWLAAFGLVKKHLFVHFIHVQAATQQGMIVCLRWFWSSAGGALWLGIGSACQCKHLQRNWGLEHLQYVLLGIQCGHTRVLNTMTLIWASCNLALLLLTDSVDSHQW